MTNYVSRFQSLDGLRAIAVCAVLIGHLRGTRGLETLSAYPRVGNTLAHLGVEMFFVISGFLITVLLVKEQRETGQISLRQFYVRRALRILPAFVVYMSCMIVASAFGLESITFTDIATALTWTVNFNPDRSWIIGHLWSLSVEEQFYLLWPVIVALVGFAKGRQWAIAAFIAAPIIRAVMHITMPYSALRDLEMFPAVADAMAIGCIIAIERDRLIASAWWLTLTRPRSVLLMLAAVGVFAPFSDHTAAQLIITPLTLVAFAALVEGSTRWIGAAASTLNLRPVIWVGTLSYSLYIWQQPFLNRGSHKLLTSFPLNIMAALSCAIASFYLVERPFLGLRRRFRGKAEVAVSGRSV